MLDQDHNRYHDRIAYNLRLSEPKVTKSESRAAAFRGFRDAIGVPLLLVGGGMTGFGALAHDIGFASWEAVLASVLVWALPAQVVAADLYTSGGDLVAIAIAAALASMRFFPMAVALLPTLDNSAGGQLGRIAQAQLMSATSWAFLMRGSAPSDPRLRLAYHTVFALTCLSIGAIGTLAGYLGAAGLPRPLALGLLFLNAASFTVLLAETRSRQALLAVLLGAGLCAPIHMVLPEASLVLASVIGGTVAFVFGDHLRKPAS